MTNINSTDEMISKSRRRGCLFYIRRGLKWFGIILIVLIVLGVAYQTFAIEQDKRNFSPRGQLYAVNGHQMHMVCTGQGSPTVILQAGATAESQWWYWVQKQLSTTTRVCAYDRAGLGWSESVTSPRDALTLAEELHTLIQQAGISPPYVMAGHSFGAILTRIYAAQYKQEVAGIVLVDSQILSAPFANQSEFDAWKTPNDAIQAVLWGATRTGLAGLIFSGQFQTWGYPTNIAPAMAAAQMRNQSFDTDYAERIAGMWSLTKASAAAEKLDNLPMAILWASNPAAVFASDAARETYRVSQEKFATYSTNTMTRYIDGADHATILGKEQYAQQVSDTILKVIKSTQTGEPLAK
jgi:pimeloyl-ACP methyl ester carboxylesterase